MHSQNKLRVIVKYTVHSIITMVILVAGYFTMDYLMQTKPRVKKRRFEREEYVKTMAVTASDHLTVIQAMGTTTPSQQIDIFPQVEGKLQSISPALVPGGFLRKGDVIAQIDPVTEKRNVAEAKIDLNVAKSQLLKAERNYLVTEKRLNVEEQKANANLKSAQKQYENARQQFERQQKLLQRQLTSEETYDLAKTTSIQKSSELATAQLRLNELKTEREALLLTRQDVELAKHQVQLQSIALKRAQQNLDYTRIKAPFDAFVIRKNIGLGSTITTNTNIATIVAVDYYWIEATIPISQLSWIRIANDNLEGSAVKITHRSWPNKAFRLGNVSRLLPQLEPEGKMAKILIKVRDPLLLQQHNRYEQVLLLGSFVRLHINGSQLKNVVKIPRKHLHDGKFVWVFRNNQLEKRLLHIMWRESEHVFVDKGIESGEKIVVSQISGAVSGMTVKEMQQ